MLAAQASVGDPIRAVTYRGVSLLSAESLGEGTLLCTGCAYSDSLVEHEIRRIDSLYFSYGRLGAVVTVDTFVQGGGVDIRLDVREGEQTRIGKVTVGGSVGVEIAEAERILDIREFDPFDPLTLEGSMQRLLDHYNDAGYPYAQVWLTGFDYRARDNVADLIFSVQQGGEAVISGIVFEGLSKTDTALAVRSTRLKRGSRYSERNVRRAAGYLRASDLFESVGEIRVSRRSADAVDLHLPVKERERSNSFQGAMGFSRKDGGGYILNGSVTVDLRNIAGSGRNTHFSWLNDGQKYSRVEFRYREPFLFRLPVHLDAEIEQVIQDTVYTWHSAGLYVRLPINPTYTILAGAAADRNVPGQGELERSIRQRYRLGFSKEGGSRLHLMLHVDGAYKKNYLSGDRTVGVGQFLYGFEGSLELAVLRRQSLYLRLVSEAVFSSQEIPIAERFTLGGARSVRGYRENQFRGERIVFSNIEYRFGVEGWLFLFDDTGAFYHPDGGWTVKNGTGFGLRSSSPLGIVVLSFGVGERLSLEGTRIHISLEERF
ncbi:MAG: BamA/TamA family outer membrane protein [bacterium]|nr:MAG: BamA/TamA family outer membrane protein [bacterium]